MKKFLTIFFLAIFGIMLRCQSVSALTEQEADVYNNLYYPQSVYNGGINATPQASLQEGYVNTATGSTNIKVTDLTLPGVNSFDLNITRTYNSTNASLFEAYLKDTEISYEATYYMITGNKVIYKYYTDSTETYEYIDNVCLTPDFGTYLDEEDAEWMVKNNTKFEYNYIEDPVKSKLFTRYSDAEAMVEYINSTSYEIQSYFPYDNTVHYEVDYCDFEIVIVHKTDYYTDFTDGLLDDTATERYSKLGSGWEFDFPYVETRYGNEDTYEYLHFGDKGIWLIDFSDGGDNNLSGYPLNDIKLVKDTSLTHDGIRSKYRVDEKDGTKHYFGKDGRLLIQEDRYGNQIKFYCDTETYKNVWGKNKDYPYINKIVDTLGREVIFTFEYDEEDYITIYMTITNPYDATDVREYIYELIKLNDSKIGITRYPECDDLDCDEWVLNCVTYPNGDRHFYEYDYLKTKFAFLDRNEDFYDEYAEYFVSTKGNSYIDDDNFEEFNGIHNTYALIKCASSNRGKSYYFDYAPFIKNCTTNGSMIVYKVVHTYEETVDSYIDDEYNLNEKLYNYDINNVGEYDGYPDFAREDNVNSSYNYVVKITEENVSTGKTSFKKYKYKYLGAKYNKTILLDVLTEQGTDHKIITNYDYDRNTKLLTDVVVKNYDMTDDGNYMTSTNAYVYDSDDFGDLLTETPNDDPDRSISYTYDATYHFPLSKVYKQDNNTIIREEYVPTTDGKKIEYANVYVNDILKSKSQFSHDSYGNIINQKEYINSQNFVETEYTYQNGAYVTNENVKNITNNDNTISDVSTSASYNYWGYIITETDGNGNMTTYDYDEMGRVIKMINPDNSDKEYVYRDTQTLIYDEFDNRVTYYHNGDEATERIRYNSLNVDYIRRYYNPFGQLDTEVLYTDDFDEEKNRIEHSRTVYTYDTYQRPIKKEIYDRTGTLIYKEIYSYEITSDYVKETTTVIGDIDNPSVVTSVYYDKFGNKIKTEVGGDCETYTCDYMGNVTSVKSARINDEERMETYQIDYDFRGNVISETDELGNITSAEYDWLGRMIKSYDAKGYATEFTYDNLGRVIEQKTPFEEKDGTVYYSTKKVWYDNNGNIIKERVTTNAPGEAESYNEVIYTYDNRNRLIMTHTSDGEKSNYTQNYYDVTGNLIRVYTGLHSPLTINGLDDVTGEDTEYAVTKYTYDEVKRLITATDALGQVETNTYDLANGLLETTTDRNGQTFNYAYNGLCSMTSKALSDESNAEITTYGKTGKVICKQNDTTTICYEYDDKGQLVSESNYDAGTIKSFDYDPNGNCISFTLIRNDNEEISLSYTYDLLNRLISVSENGNLIVSYSYDEKGNRVETAVTDGQTTSYTYNLANMLTSQTTGNKLWEQFTYYLNGNQRSKLSNGHLTSYSYDSMNRLVRENDTEYTFDDFGNRHTKIDGEITTTYSYDLNNRLTESIEENGDVTTSNKFFYDYNGNLITKATMVNQPYSEGMSGDYTISNTSDSFVALYEYNCYNQLVGVDTNGVVSSYAYAPDGLRHSKTVGGNTTTFVYDNANIVEEITADSTNKYYRGIEIIKNDDGLYYLYNGQGDVSLIVDGSGSSIANYEFDAYGNQSQENEVYNPFGYRGEYTDSESGLLYLRNRYYDASSGRFISEDFIEDGINWYLYCTNNPITFVDPLGLIPTAKEAALMAEHIYNVTKDEYNESLGEGFGGWQLQKIITNDEGLKMGVYSRTINGKTEYSLVNKGSTTKGDWVNNFQQPVGFSTDMKDSIQQSKTFVANHSGYEVTMIGHSKGGAEAVANAVATNTNCIVFNPATTFLQSYDLSADGYTSDMYVYAVKGEPLTTLESFFSKPIDKYVELKAKPLPKRKWWQVKKIKEDLEYLHSMEAVIWGLNEHYK